MGTQWLIAERYSLVEPLPGSATGIGWRAQDLWSGRLVAITRVAVFGLVGEPVGNTLNHNLMVELLLSATLVPPDLRLLD